MKPPIDPIVWTPPPRDARARYATGARPFPSLHRIPLPACGEDVAVDAAGRLVTGLDDGRIVRITLADDVEKSPLEVVVDTGGRPAGIEIAADGTYVVCDAKRGVLRVDPEQKQLEVLVDAVARDMRLCNNAAIARDGSIYFSDSSRHFGIDYWMGDVLEHSGTGRLLRRTPDGKVEVLLDGLAFANGVALASDESFVAVAELGAYRISRLYLHGPRAGEHDVLLPTVPGFPDNLATDDTGLIWIAVPTPRNPLLDFLHQSHPLLRRTMWALPHALLPKPARSLCVMAIDASGQVVHDFAGEHRAFHMITGVRVVGRRMFLASLSEPALAVATLP